MSMTHISPPAPFGSITTYRVVQVVDTAFRTLRAWRRSRAVQGVLSGLPERMLDDMGVTRSGEIKGKNR